MAETAKPKPRRGSKTQNPAAKSRARTAAKPEASQELAAEASAKTAKQATASDGEHVKITPPAPTKKSSGAWFFSFLLIIVIVGVGHVTWPRWQPYVMAYVPDGLNIAFDDSRVDGLTARIGELESKTISLRQRDKEIVRLESEREELQQSLAGVLEHIESLERSIFAVKEMAKAAATATVDEAAAASHELKELNERLRKLEIAPAPAQSGDPAFASRLGKLEKDRTLAQDFSQRIVKLENSSTRSRQVLAETLDQLDASRQTVQALEGRVASVEARPVGNESGKLSMIILAVSELRDAVHRGRPYVTELEAVKAAAGNGPPIRAALKSLDKNAAEGIGTLSSLREAFSKLANTIVAVDRYAPDAGWMDRALGRISSLVKFRRTDGSSEAASTEFLVSRAEKHLATGDLAAAVNTIKQLDDAAKATASTWLSSAMARLSAEQSLASLHAHAVAMLSAVKG